MQQARFHFLHLFPRRTHSAFALRLTREAGMAILECMLSRRVLWLAIVLSLCVASAGFLPVGVGPYTAVYGPASALRAQRAILLLALAISFLSARFAELAALGALEAAIFHTAAPARRFCPSSPMAGTLRC